MKNKNCKFHGQVKGASDRCRCRKKITNYKVKGVIEVDQVLNHLLINPKGGRGLHKDSFKLQTMTALIKSFCRGVQGGQFFQKAPPLAAGGRNG